MPPRDPQATITALRDHPLKVDAYFLRQTGFLPSQTVLRLGEYNVNCVPATLGVEEAQFLAVLSPSEQSMFAKYKEGTHILILSFDRPETRDIARFPLRVGLMELLPVPDRKNVCLFRMKLRTLPAELVLFLGVFLEGRETKLLTWERGSQEWESIDLEAAVSAGIGPGFVLTHGEDRLSVRPEAFHTRALRLAVDPALATWAGRASVLKFSFQGRILSIDGEVNAQNEFHAEFHPDWLEALEEYRFHVELRARSRKKGTA